LGFKTWAVGEILKAADVNQYLARQVIAVVTSSTRPENPVEGQMIYETDTKSLVLYTGSGWETLVYHGPFKTYTPEWIASITNPSIGNGTLIGRYRRLPGRMVWLRISWSRGSTTNMGEGVYSFGLPPGLPAETGTRWIGTVVGGQDSSDVYSFWGAALILAGSAGTHIDRIRWDISDANGDLDNWASDTTAPTFNTGGFFTINLLYETTATSSGVDL